MAVTLETEVGKIVKQSMDPFEAASMDLEDFQEDNMETQSPPTSAPSEPLPVPGSNVSNVNNEDEEEEEENMDVFYQNIPFPNNGDPDKLAKTKAIFKQLTGDQMDRYEFFRRSRFKKSDMRKLLLGITGMMNISEPMIVAVSATTKMFVGEIVETAREVMAERKDSGPVRPSHIREAFRRLKLEGKVPRKSMPKLFL